MLQRMLGRKSRYKTCSRGHRYRGSRCPYCWTGHKTETRHETTSHETTSHSDAKAHAPHSHKT